MNDSWREESRLGESGDVGRNLVSSDAKASSSVPENPLVSEHAGIVTVLEVHV
jgi:hypothetical protein